MLPLPLQRDSRVWNAFDRRMFVQSGFIRELNNNEHVHIKRSLTEQRQRLKACIHIIHVHK